MGFDIQRTDMVKFEVPFLTDYYYHVDKLVDNIKTELVSCSCPEDPKAVYSIELCNRLGEDALKQMILMNEIQNSTWNVIKVI